MKFNRSLYILIVLLLCLCKSGQAQDNTALENDSAYISLLENEKVLSARQDSIQRIISQKRDMLSKDTGNRNKYTTEITDLETVLFDIRAQLGKITSQLNALEQAYILRNLNNETGSAANDASTIQHKHLLANKFIKDNISKEEMSVMNMSQQKISKLNTLGEEFLQLYEQKTQLAESYKNAPDKQNADSLLVLWEQLKTSSKQIENDFTAIWEPVYSLKYDVYRRLLDKISAPAQLLETLNEKSRNLRSEESEARSSYDSAPLAMYPSQRLLITEYESALADQLGLTQAKDSLNKVIASIDKETYALPLVKLSQMEFVNFIPVTIGGNQVHSDENPIPELTVPSKGSLFKVEIATYSKPPTTYSVFKKVYPIEYTVLPDGKYRYYAGSYNNREEAVKANTRLRQYGFKARVVEWKDGYELDEKGEPIIAIPVSDAYRVVFPEMTDDIRKIVADSDKELSRIDVDGQTMYAVGLFNEQSEAQAIAARIGNSAKIIGVNLSE